MDIGGTHAVAGVVHLGEGSIVEGSRERVGVDAGGDAAGILAAWCGALRRALDSSRADSIAGVGIAMPGPFDYDGGVCLIRGLAKYESLYGVNVRTAIKERVPRLRGVPVIFRNDAICFMLGEAGFGAARGFGRVIVITLGTGFGSGFLRDGAIVEGATTSHQAGGCTTSLFAALPQRSIRVARIAGALQGDRRASSAGNAGVG